jgi:hypothetical protein
VHAARTQAAIAVGGDQQGVDDFQANQTGPQAKGLEYKPDPLIARAFGTSLENDGAHEVPLGAGFPSVGVCEWYMQKLLSAPDQEK